MGKNIEISVSAKKIRDIKEAYRKLYFETRKVDIPREMQDELLEKLFREKFIERFNKLKEENAEASKSKNFEFLKELEKLMGLWRIEFETGVEEDSTVRKITLKRKWWQFWKL